MEPDPDEHVPPGQEDLQWGTKMAKDDEKRFKKGSAPGAKYNKFSEQARKLIPGENQCQMFCGGKKCKYCTAENWKPKQMAVKGLYSEWVTDNILAMARPSNHGFDNQNFLGQFEENNIKTVINLQQPGEHASCGHGNDGSGFSYNPQRLMEKDIFFYNFSWQDYGIAPMSTLLDIVKVMQFSVSMGKVAIHCHAGLGRTGLLIACYLVYNNRVPAGDAVQYVRSRRPGSIQTRQQVQAVFDFETHLKPFRTIFPSKVSEASEVSFKHFLNRQSHMLHGFEGRKLKHIPKVVYFCCERLLELAGKGQSLTKMRQNSSGLISLNSASPVSNAAASHDAMSFTQDSMSMDSNLLGVNLSRNMRGSVSFEDLTNSHFKKVLAVEDDQQDVSSNSTGPSDAVDEVFQQPDTKADQDKARIVVKSSDGVAIKSDDKDDDDDDDCIVFGKPDVKIAENNRQEVSSADERKISPRFLDQTRADRAVSDAALRSSSPKTDDVGVVDSVSAKSLDCIKSDRSCASSKAGSSHSNSTDPDAKNEIASNDSDSTKKRRVKKKGISERLKARARKKDVNNSLAITPSAVETAKNGDRMEGEGLVSSGSDSKNHTTIDTVSEETRSSVVVTDLKEMSQLVCNAMAATEYSADVRKKADHIEDQLNETDSAWGLLADEEDPQVLSAVFWDWLDQLKEPVLRRQDLNILLEHSDSPKQCLRHLEKSIKEFTEYQAMVLSKLFPQPEALETRLAERLLSHLTHHSVTLSLTSHLSTQSPHWGEMRSSESTHLMQFLFQLIDEIAIPKKSQ